MNALSSADIPAARTHAFPVTAIALLCGLSGLTPLRGNLRPRYGAFLTGGRSFRTS